MTDKIYTSTTSRILITVASVVVIIAGLRAASSIVVPFLMALFLAVICSAPATWLQRRGISTWLSILVVIVSILIIGSVVTSLVGASIKDFLIALPGYNAALDMHFEGIVQWFEKRGLDVGSFKITEAFEPAAVMQLTANLLRSLRDLLANGFLILLTVIFMLVEASNIPGKLKSILTNPEEALTHFETFSKDVRHYLAIKTWMCLLTGFLVTVLLMVLGIDYPILWGLLAFLLNYIPAIGSIIAAVPAVFLTVIQLGVGWAIGVVVGYIVINLVVSNILEPRIMGKGLGLSTLVVFLSLIFWGWVLGPVGMVLSVPLTVTVRIAMESREDTKWIAVILGSS